MRPLGMENGLIESNQITTSPDIGDKNSVRLNNAAPCSSPNINNIEIDLGRIITITGFAFSKSVKVDKMTVNYRISKFNDAAARDGRYLIKENKYRGDSARVG